MLVLVCLSVVVLDSCVSGGKFYLLFFCGIQACDELVFQYPFFIDSNARVSYF